MKITLDIFFFFIIFAFSYFLISLLTEKRIYEKISKYIADKNQKYYEEIIKYQNKNKKIKLTTKISLIYRINLWIERAGIKIGLLINPIMIIIYSVLTFVLCYGIVFSFFKIPVLSLIISLPAVLLPKVVLGTIFEIKANNIEKSILDFVLQLKNYTQINNDIVYAFEQIKTTNPLQSYIDKFLVEINSGIKFEKAIENIKEKIDFKILKSFFSNIEHCYIFGGDFKELMDKSYKMIGKVQKEKQLRKQETKSARIVLGILIFLDLFVYFNFIKSNYDNYLIMTSRILGNVILYWNFISIWFLVILMNNVKKLDY